MMERGSRACGGQGRFFTVVEALSFLPYLLIILVSAGGPLAILIGSFWQDGQPTLEVWFEVFSALPRWGALLVNTVRVLGWALLTSLPVGLLLGFLLFRTDIWARQGLIVLLLLAAMIPLYVVAGTFLSFCSREAGLGSQALAGVIHGTAHLPIVILVLGLAFRSINPDVEELALLDGLGPLDRVRLFLRLAGPGLAASALLVSLWVTTDCSVTDMLVVRTFAEEVYTQYALAGRPHEPLLVSLPQMAIMAGLMFLMRGSLYAGDEPVLPSSRSRRIRLGWWRALCSVVVLLLAALFFETILGRLLGRLRPDDSLWRFARMFSTELRLSVVTSLTAGALTALLGVGLAWRLVRRPRWRVPVLSYVILMLSLPGSIHGIGLVTLFNRPGVLGRVYDSPVMIVLGCVVRFLPIAVLILVPAIRALASECEESARTEGCGRLGVLAWIVFPQCRYSLLVCAFVVAILSVGELPCSILVAPPDCATVGVRFFSLIHYGLYADAAALCILSMLLLLAPAFCLLLLLRGWLRQLD